MNSNERNLLVGVLALQLEIVSRQELVSAFQVWLTDRSMPLENLLVKRGTITRQQQELVRVMAEKYSQLFAADLAQNIGKLSHFTTLASFVTDLNDAELDATVAHCSAHAPDATRANSAADDSASGFEIDDQAHGRYRILRPYAQGGLGEVLVALDTELHREVAVKKILPRYANNKDQQARFVIEAEITGRLEHPGIVPVYSLAQSAEGQPFYAMRFIHGDSLKQAIQEFHENVKTASDPNLFLSGMRRLLNRFVDVCNAVEYAHCRGVLHRDLKPANIMLGKHGETLVVDWGLAKTIGKTAPHEDVDELTIVPTSGDSSRTRMGSVVGTLAFMSPEQADGRLDLLDPRTDVYSLGATLYALLTGKDSIDRGTESDMLYRVRTGQVKPLREVNPLVPAPLASICQRAMAVRRDDRYTTAAELAEEIERWLADEPVVAHPESLLDRSVRWLRRNRTVATGLSVAVSLGLVSAVIVSLITTSQNAALRQANDAEKTQRIKAEEAERLEMKQREQLSSFALQLLANAETDLANVPEAEQYQGKQMDLAFQSLKQVAMAPNASPDLRRSYAIACRLSGVNAARNLNAAEGEQRLKESIAVQQLLLQQEPSPANEQYMGETLRDLANIMRATGRLTEAFKVMQQTVSISDKLLAAEPSTTAYRRLAATAKFTYAGLQSELNQPEKALADAQFAWTTLQQLSTSQEASLSDDQYAMLAGSLLGQMLLLRGQTEPAQQHFAVLLEFIQPLIEKHRDHRRESFVIARILLGSVECDAKANQITQTTFDNLARAEEILVSMRKFKNRTYSLFEADGRRLRGKLLLAQGKASEAIVELDAAQTQIDTLLKQMNQSLGSPEFLQVISETLTDRMNCHKALNDPTGIAQVREQADALLKTARQRYPEQQRAIGVLVELTETK